MPNWCYTSVCFKGKPENIIKLRIDIMDATKWSGEHPSYCNLRYFLSLSNFDTISYRQKYDDLHEYINTRGSIYDHKSCNLHKSDSDLLYFPVLEMAWDNDYQILSLISLLYDVKFSACSQEPGMDIYHKCKNMDTDIFDFDYCIIPDAEQFEQALSDANYVKDLSDIEYENLVNRDSEDESKILDILKKFNIDYSIETIYQIETPLIYGVYYDYIYGVSYDKPQFANYPTLDPFNINNKVI